MRQAKLHTFESASTESGQQTLKYFPPYEVHSDAMTKLNSESRRMLLLDCLNVPRRDRDGKVLNAVKDIHSLLARLRDLPPLNKTRSDFWLRGGDEMLALNSVLSQITTVPRLALGYEGRSIHRTESFRYENADSMSTSALMGLLDLIAADETDLLRRCDCGKWFLASRSDQKSCGPACRQRRYAAKPSTKADRRRNYRRNKQRTAKRSGNAKASK